MKLLHALLVFLLLGPIFFSCTDPVAETAEKSIPVQFPGQRSAFAYATREDLVHSLVLFPDSIVVKTEKLGSTLPYDAIPAFMVQNRNELDRQTLNLVVANGVSYKQVVDILDLMTLHKIKNYKMLHYPR